MTKPQSRTDRQQAARQLALAGCTAHEIMAITGHKTLAAVERYIAEARVAIAKRKGVE